MNKNKCICGKTIQIQSKNYVTCIICSHNTHSECFKPVRDLLELPKEILCYMCTLNKINPYEYIESIYLEPIFLPFKPKDGKVLGRFNIVKDKVKAIRTNAEEKIYIYCILLYDQIFTSIKNIRWPESEKIKIFYNEKPLYFTPKEPLNISMHVQEKNTIEFLYEQLDKKYLIFITGNKTIALEDIGLNNVYTYQECKDMAIKALKEQMINQEKISVKCPFTSKIMQTPVKVINKARKIFNCPICKNITYVDDLYLDRFYLRMINASKAKLKDRIEDVSVYIRGTYFTKNEMNGKSMEIEDTEDSRYIESLNYSPQYKHDYENKSKIDLNNDLEVIDNKEKDEENYAKLKIKYLKIRNIHVSSRDKYYDNVLNDLYNADILQSIPPKYYSKFLIEFNLKPVKNKLIFPKDIESNKTNNYEDKCLEIYNKYSYLYKYLAIWNNKQVDLVSLIIDITDNNIDSRHYFALELLLGIAYYLYKDNPIENNLELVLGRLIGIYCMKNKMDDFATAHMIDLIIRLFPEFYLANRNFVANDEMINYHNRIVRFFYGIFGYFPVEQVGKMFVILFIPIMRCINKLSETEILYIELLENYLLSPLLGRLEYTISEKARFVSTWDIKGNFRHFLFVKKRLLSYGYECIKSIENYRKKNSNKNKDSSDIDIEIDIEIDITSCFKVVSK